MKKLMLIDNSNNNYMFADENGKIYRSIMWFENFATKPTDLFQHSAMHESPKG